MTQENQPRWRGRFTRFFETRAGEVFVYLTGGENAALDHLFSLTDHRAMNPGTISVSVKIDFPDDKTGWEKAEAVFRNYDDEQAAKIAQTVREALIQLAD